MIFSKIFLFVLLLLRAQCYSLGEEASERDSSPGDEPDQLEEDPMDNYDSSSSASFESNSNPCGVTGVSSSYPYNTRGSGLNKRGSGSPGEGSSSSSSSSSLDLSNPMVRSELQKRAEGKMKQLPYNKPVNLFMGGLGFARYIIQDKKNKTRMYIVEQPSNMANFERHG